MTESIEIQTDQPSAVKLQFSKASDRWTHQMVWASQDSESIILTSIEGTPDQDWPASPPLQDVSKQSLEVGEAILCVGMAGKSHWSAAYSIEEKSLIADVACLRKEISPTATLGSNYRLESDWIVQSADDNRIELQKDSQTIRLIAISGSDYETVFELQDKTLVVSPNQISDSPKIASRWGFRVMIHTAE